MRHILRLFLLLMVAGVLAGCPAGGGSEKKGDKITIIATTGMVADLARQVGGEHVEVEALMGPGTDPHLYQASPGDVSKINNADVVLYSGLHLEGKMADIFEKVGKKKPTYAVATAVDESRLLGMGQAHDPHIWFDVELWSSTLGPLAEFLGKADPDNAEEFKSRAEQYESKLKSLHETVKSELQKVPKEQRVLITAHDAFQYFGRAYDVEVRGIQGISTESEAGVRQINDLVSLMVQRKVKAVFVETSVSQKNVQALIEGAKRRGLDARVGGSLFSDAMGAEETPEGTYEGMILHNVGEIVNALK